MEATRLDHLSRGAVEEGGGPDRSLRRRRRDGGPGLADGLRDGLLGILRRLVGRGPDLWLFGGAPSPEPEFLGANALVHLDDIGELQALALRGGAERLDADIRALRVPERLAHHAHVLGAEREAVDHAEIWISAEGAVKGPYDLGLHVGDLALDTQG